MRYGHSDEDGAVAVLYSIVIMLLLGMVAVVIDLGALRADRRQGQTIADLAAVAGASELLPDVGVAASPRQACVTAFEYILENMVDAPTAPSSSFCNVLPATMTQPCESYAGPIVASTDLDPYFVAIAWPVPNDHEWMTNRHAYDAEVDGESACDRLAVQVSRTRGFIFGGVAGRIEGTAAAPAVARASLESGEELVAALVVLDPYACNTLLESGGGTSGAIHVFESRRPLLGEDGVPTGEVVIGPGIIAVDSDASAPGSGTYGCSNKRVIELNGTNTQIYSGVKSDGTGTTLLDGSGRPRVGAGIIFSYAIKAGRQALAYNPGHVTGSQLAGGDDAEPLPGNPPVGGDRVSREPWLWRYDCRTYTGETVGGAHVDVADCPGVPEDGVTAGSKYVTSLRATITGATAPFVDETGTLVRRDTTGALYRVVIQGPGNRCDLTPFVTSTDPNLFVFPERWNWWFDCNLDVQSNNRVIIPDGNVVVMGNISLQGALAINTTSQGDTDVDGVDNWLYVRGNWSKSGGAALRLGNPSLNPNANEGGTFVLLGGVPSTSPGRIQMTGGSSSGSTVTVEGTRCNTVWNDPGLRWTPCHFTWVAPYQGAFEDLGLWSEYHNITNAPHTIGGDLSNLIADGVFYMPNAKFDFGGGGEMGQQRAQFIAYRLQAAGNGALKIQPDPDRARAIKFVVPELIR